MVLIHANHRALKRTMRLALKTPLLVAPLGTIEHATQLGKPTLFVGRHNGLLAQDTIRQIGGIGVEPHQRHDKKHRRAQQKAKAVKLLRKKLRDNRCQPRHTREQPRGQYGALVVGKVQQSRIVLPTAYSP